MVNQQHQRSISATNEKGSQRRQLEVGDSVMSRDKGIWSGVQDWLSTRQVHWCTRCRWHQGLFGIDISTSWSQKQLSTQLRSLTPTLLRSANPKQPAHHQRQSNWVLHLMADQPEMVPVPTPIVPDPPEATPVSRMVHEGRYPQRVRRAPQRLDLWTVFLFFLVFCFS